MVKKDHIHSFIGPKQKAERKPQQRAAQSEHGSAQLT